MIFKPNHSKPGMRSLNYILNAVICLLFSSCVCATEPNMIVSTDTVSCYGGSNGAIRIIIPDVSQIYTAYLYKYSPSPISLEAKRINDSTYFLAKNLVAGKYFIEIKGDKGFSQTKSVEVVQPNKLRTGKIEIEKKLSALDAGDAILRATSIGGTLPYTYTWNIDGIMKHSAIIKNVSQGIYTCIINDVNDCGPVKTTILFNQHVMPNIVKE